MVPNGTTIARTADIVVPYIIEQTAKKLIKPDTKEMNIAEAIKNDTKNPGLVTLIGEVTAVSIAWNKLICLV